MIGIRHGMFLFKCRLECINKLILHSCKIIQQFLLKSSTADWMILYFPVSFFENIMHIKRALSLTFFEDVVCRSEFKVELLTNDRQYHDVSCYFLQDLAHIYSKFR